VPGTGNTTVPTPDDPSSPFSSSAPGSPARLVSALFLVWSRDQHDRVGQVALFDPLDPTTPSLPSAPAILGREKPGDPPCVHFLELRAGETIDAGALTGINLSSPQFHITVEGDALRVLNVGTAVARADGTVIPRGTSVLLRPGAILEVHGNCLLLVGLSPVSIPPPPACFLPLRPFGDPDRLGLVGESARMHQLREDIAYAASSGRHVFVHGESGTGKGPVARAIHDLSPRSSGPYITANSASFTAELAAVELFGNPKSFPNPGTPERPGYFGLAQGGTLLLDEMGEVLTAVQAPLLHALEGQYNRVGDPVARPTKCIVIVATNRDPASIKHDVLHRLGVTVETPALADRREDIPQLVRALLLRKADADPAFAKAFVRQDARGWRYVEVDPSLIVGLLRSPLPGNVREVDKILTMAIAASGGHPPLRWPARLPLPPPASLPSKAEPIVPPAESSGQSIADLKAGMPGARTPSRETLHRLLVKNLWDYTKTAEQLGMTVHKLYRLRVKYDLHRPE